MLNLKIGYNYVEMEEKTSYSFDIPSNYSAYITSSEKIDDDFQITLKNGNTKTFKGDSKNKGHSFHLESNEAIIEYDDDDAKFQIWVIEKGLCDNVAYAFYPKKQSKLQFSFQFQDRVCIFLPFLKSKAGSAKIKSNQQYLIYDENMNARLPDGDSHQMNTDGPFFLLFDSAKSLDTIELTLEFKKLQHEIDHCRAESFSSFDFENGFLSKTVETEFNYESNCENESLPVWAILLIVFGSIIILVLLIIGCCYCCKCCHCCKFVSFLIKKVNPKKSSSSLDSVEKGQIQDPSSIHPFYEPNAFYSQPPHLVSPVYYQDSIPPVHDLHAPDNQYHYPSMQHDPNHHPNSY